MTQIPIRLGSVSSLILFGAAIAVAPLSWSQQARRPISRGITLVEIAGEMHLSLPPLDHPADATALKKPIPSAQYSLDFARQVLIPAMGSSVAIGDLDGSGYPDLYVVRPGTSNHFFRNLRNGTFADATEKTKLSGTGSDLSATFGDYDHSGHASLFVAGLGGARLYHNNGDGTFSDVTDKAGIKGNAGELATSVLLFDAEGNGSLDLLVTIYTDLNAPPAKSSFVFPNDFSSASSHLYHNQGDGTFREISMSAGLVENPGRTHKAIAADFNHTGRLDLLLLRDNKPPVLYRNKGQGTFEDQTWETGAENWKYAYLDAQVADFDRDGKIDLALWSTIGNEVLMNEGKGKFAPEKTLPIVFGANRAFGFHGTVADLKGDGYDDLLTVDNNGDWHYIANRHGHFVGARLSWQTSGARRAKAYDRAALPQLASLIPVRLQKSSKVVLVGVQMNGRIVVLEKRP